MLDVPYYILIKLDYQRATTGKRHMSSTLYLFYKLVSGH